MEKSQLTFSIPTTLRLSTFQIGSAMGDILATAVWNRILISDLGLPAGPVGLLIALRYLISPLSIWAGHRSDTHPLFGLYRTPYIWAGRGLMVLSFPLLAVSLTMFGNNNSLGWLVALACFLLYGIGTLLSGSPFLALVRDSAPREKQGLAISMVETALITLFPLVAIGFGRWKERYDPAVFWQMVLFTMAVSAFFWFFAVFRVERRNRRLGSGPKPTDVVEHTDFRATFSKIWHDPRTRLFFIFLSLATFAAWMQDNVMEPFGGDVFDMPIGETTRFTGYWGGATVLVLVPSFYFWRRRPPERQAPIAFVGLMIMAVGMALTGTSGLLNTSALLLPALVVFGGGFGLYTFGGLSLMAVMSPDSNAGAYLGLWTISVLISKGLGTFFGGLLRDIFLAVNLSQGMSYGLIFVVSALLLAAAALLLLRLDVVGFAREYGRIFKPGDIQIAAD